MGKQVFPRGGLIEVNGKEYRVTPAGDVYVRYQRKRFDSSSRTIERRLQRGGNVIGTVRDAFRAALVKGGFING